MPKKIGNVDEALLRGAPVPLATSTYTAISHSDVIDTIKNELTAAGFNIVKCKYRAGDEAKVVSGTIYTDYGGDPSRKLVYNFMNSYDKSQRFTAAVGVGVTVNEAVLVGAGMSRFVRKHTGTADQEMIRTVQEHVKDAQIYYDNLLSTKKAMENIMIDDGRMGQIIGHLFMLDHLGADQMGMIKREYEKPSFTYSTPHGSLWTCYNHIVYALQSSHPTKWLMQQAAIHLYFLSAFNLDGQFTLDRSGVEEEEEDDDDDDATETFKSATGEVLRFPGYVSAEEKKYEIATSAENSSEVEGDTIEEISIPSDLPDENGNNSHSPGVVTSDFTVTITEEDVAAQESLSVAPDKKEEDVPDWVTEDQSKAPVVSEPVVNGPIHNESDQTDASFLYISKEELAGVTVGDFIVMEGVGEVKVSGEENIENVPYWKLETVLSIRSRTESLQDVSEAETSSAEEPEQKIPSDLEMEFENEVVDKIEANIRLVIANEIADIYGEADENFTYSLEANQFIVILSTGEGITMPYAYITTAASKL